MGGVRVSFFRELTRWSNPAPEIERFGDPSFDAYANAWFRYQGQMYAPAVTTSIPGSKTEPVADNYIGYVQNAYKSNGVIFAVSQARAMLFTDITFKWRRYGQTGGGNDLFGTTDLAVLERPWPGGTTQQLLARAEQDVTNIGTFFVAREGDRLRRLRPDWCEFILSADPTVAVEADVVGIRYEVGGRGRSGEVKLYPVNPGPGVNPDGFAAFWSPIPDPAALYRGMSWLTPVIQEMQADRASTDHKLKFFENGASVNMVISLADTVTVEQFQAFVQAAKESTTGVVNAYKPMYLGGGASVTPIGSTMQQMDFAVTQGHGETRICAAGRVPPIIVGLSEGLSAATYSNYAQARRAFGDSWARPMWKSFAGAVESLLELPTNAAGQPDAQLWYDARDVAFLREDTKDLAEVQSTTATTINALLAAGWTPESAQAAVLAEDLSLLVHSGLMSVQLQPPGAQDKGPTDADQAQVFATQVGALVQLSAGPFDPESAVAATEAGDLAQLVYVEPEPAPDPLAAEDPNAPLVDDAPVEDGSAVRYSGGMDATRHLPGRHNQQAHANRIGKPTNVPGKTGLSKIAGDLKDAPDQGPVLAKKARTLGTYAARRDAVKEHAKLTRREFDDLPDDEQKAILAELKQAADAPDQHTGSDNMGIKIRGRAAHVTDAQYELRKFTKVQEALPDNSPSGRLGRAQQADTAAGIRNALYGAKKAELAQMAREIGMFYSDGWKVDKFMSMIAQRLLAKKADTGT